MPSDARAVRSGLAVAAAALSATVVYALLRIGQTLVTTDVDPALVIYSEHAGYFWRALTSGYVGGMLGFATWLLAARDAGRVARLLCMLAPFVAVLSAAQGLFVP